MLIVRSSRLSSYLRRYINAFDVRSDHSRSSSKSLLPLDQWRFPTADLDLTPTDLAWMRQMHETPVLTGLYPARQEIPAHGLEDAGVAAPPVNGGAVFNCAGVPRWQLQNKLTMYTRLNQPQRPYLDNCGDHLTCGVLLVPRSHTTILSHSNF